MRLPALLLVLLGFLLLAGGPAFAEDVCSKCKGKGEVACTKHEALNVEGGLKVGEFVCADCLDLECCHGMGWTPCSKCKNAVATERWKARIEEAKAECTAMLEHFEGKVINAKDCRFVQERNARRKPAGDAKPQAVPRAFLNILECPHLVLMTDMAGRRVNLKGGLTPLDAHQVQHLYLGRMTEVLKDALDLHLPGALDERPAAKEKGEEGKKKERKKRRRTLPP